MDAPAGGMARQRILESIQRLITTCTAQKVGAMRSPSDMTEEELEETA
jgi:hypothetical protein